MNKMNKKYNSVKALERSLLGTLLGLVLLAIVLSFITAERPVPQEEDIPPERPELDPLTPNQVLEYIDIFHLEVDITSDQILAGEDFVLTATDETAELLFRINYFTTGLHTEWALLDYFFPVDAASEEFFEAYVVAYNARRNYAGFLTAHWRPAVARTPFLRIEHVMHFPEEIYQFYINIPHEILRRVYIEVDGLPLWQYLDLLHGYYIRWDKGFWLEYDGTGILFNNERTDEYIAHLNRLYLDNPSFYREGELMREFGLSEENPLTFEWVISNPTDALSLRHESSKFSQFGVPTRTFLDGWFIMLDIPFFPPEHDPYLRGDDAT